MSRNDNQSGPFTAATLKQLAANGKLLPSDLVWKDGSDDRKPASSIKGLFPIAPPELPSLPNQRNETRTLPPPLPKADRLTSDSKSEASDTIDFHGLQTPTPSEQVSLWSPFAIIIYGFFLSPLFGSCLLYRNWNALGKSDLARRSLYWFYGYLGLIVLIALGLYFDNELIPMLMGKIAIGGMAVWIIREAAPHVDYVNKNIGRSYERKSTIKQLGVFVACVLIYVILIMDIGGDAAFMGDASPKLVALRKLTAALKDSPDKYAGISEREAWNEKVGTLQQEFQRTPFDTKEDPESAKAIVELYKNEVEGRYAGEYVRILEINIMEIYEQLLNQ